MTVSPMARLGPLLEFMETKVEQMNAIAGALRG